MGGVPHKTMPRIPPPPKPVKLRSTLGDHGGFDKSEFGERVRTATNEKIRQEYIDSVINNVETPFGSYESKPINWMSVIRKIIYAAGLTYFIIKLMML